LVGLCESSKERGVQLRLCWNVGKRKGGISEKVVTVRNRERVVNDFASQRRLYFGAHPEWLMATERREGYADGLGGPEVLLMVQAILGAISSVVVLG